MLTAAITESAATGKTASTLSPAVSTMRPPVLDDRGQNAHVVMHRPVGGLFIMVRQTTELHHIEVEDSCESTG